MIDRDKFTEQAISRAREGALSWLQGASGCGYPKTLECEQAIFEHTGFQPDYEFEALTILGYEKLVEEGLAERGEIIEDEERDILNQRRKYTITEAGKTAKCNEDAW